MAEDPATLDDPVRAEDGGAIRMEARSAQHRHQQATPDIAGFGLGLVLNRPFTFARAADWSALRSGPDPLTVGHQASDGVRTLLLVPLPEAPGRALAPDLLPRLRFGDVVLRLGANSGRLADVARLGLPRHESRWVVGCGPSLSFDLPDGAAVRSRPDADEGVEITVPAADPDEFVFLRGPWPTERAPALEDLVEPAQVVVDHGMTPSSFWLHLEKQYGDRRWQQWWHMCFLAGDAVAAVGVRALASRDWPGAIGAGIARTLRLSPGP